MNSKPTLWLRAEHKPLEQRVAVTPSVAKKLLDAGFPVVIEASTQRAIPLQAYLDVGCTEAAEHSWSQAPSDAIIIGLKELSPELGPFQHRHIHFAHVYKQQQGWQSMLAQFIQGQGELYDLEFLVDESGRRIAAFGYWAGYVGAAAAVLSWVQQQHGQTLGGLSSWASREELQQSVQMALATIADQPNCVPPKALVMGALGRSGRGAVELLRSCGIATTEWDQKETAQGGPFDELLAHHLMVNCVFLGGKVPPFTTHEHLASSQRLLSVISDVSCDPYSDANPLPIYSECTTITEPVERILQASDDQPALDIISIDHLPSLLPVESSEDYAAQLASHLLQLDDLSCGVWGRAHTVFKQKCAEAQQGAQA